MHFNGTFIKQKLIMVVFAQSMHLNLTNFKNINYKLNAINR